MALAFVGVAIFAGTLPATRVAVAWFDPAWVALGRAIGAAGVAAVALWLTRSPMPPRSLWRPIALSAFGVVLGFPLFTSLAMRTGQVAHGAIVVALLPFATAALAHHRLGESKPVRFWIAGLAGTVLVLVFALSRSGPASMQTNLILLCAVAAAALGYVEGGRIAAVLGGWQSISWCLIAAAPLLIGPAAWLTLSQPFAQAPLSAWFAFGYVTLLSQWLGFLFWYGGMSRAGVAGASQVQLLQLFLTLSISALFLGEPVGWPEWLTAAAVVVTILLGRR